MCVCERNLSLNCKCQGIFVRFFKSFLIIFDTLIYNVIIYMIFHTEKYFSESTLL